MQKRDESELIAVRNDHEHRTSGSTPTFESRVGTRNDRNKQD
jgi:hypothetical protein